jgi:hypothetical protein
MRNLAIQRDPAKPPPGDRIGYLPAQAFVAQPVAKLQKHHPQIRLHRRRWPTHPRIEERHKRCKERGVIQQRIHPSQLARQHLKLSGQDRLPQTWLITYRSEHDDLDPF